MQLTCRISWFSCCTHKVVYIPQNKTCDLYICRKPCILLHKPRLTGLKYMYIASKDDKFFKVITIPSLGSHKLNMSFQLITDPKAHLH